MQIYSVAKELLKQHTQTHGAPRSAAAALGSHGRALGQTQLTCWLFGSVLVAAAAAAAAAAGLVAQPGGVALVPAICCMRGPLHGLTAAGSPAGWQAQPGSRARGVGVADQQVPRPHAPRRRAEHACGLRRPGHGRRQQAGRGGAPGPRASTCWSPHPGGCWTTCRTPGASCSATWPSWSSTRPTASLRWFLGPGDAACGAPAACGAATQPRSAPHRQAEETALQLAATL